MLGYLHRKEKITHWSLFLSTFDPRSNKRRDYLTKLITYHLSPLIQYEKIDTYRLIVDYFSKSFEKHCLLDQLDDTRKYRPQFTEVFELSIFSALIVKPDFCCYLCECERL